MEYYKPMWFIWNSPPMVSRSPVFFWASQRPRPRGDGSGNIPGIRCGSQWSFCLCTKGCGTGAGPGGWLKNDRFVEEREIFAVNSPKWVKTMVFWSWSQKGISKRSVESLQVHFGRCLSSKYKTFSFFALGSIVAGSRKIYQVCFGGKNAIF